MNVIESSREMHQKGAVESFPRRNLPIVLAENGIRFVSLQKFPRARLENRSVGAEIDKRSDVYAACITALSTIL